MMSCGLWDSTDVTLNAAKLIIFLWWKYEQTRGRILLQDRGQGNKSIRIGERDRRARSKFLRGRGDPGRCRRGIRFLPYTLFLPRTFSPSNKGEAVINTCVYSSTTFPPSSPPVSARHLCLEAPRPLNFSPCVCVRMTLPVIIFTAAVLSDIFHEMRSRTREIVAELPTRESAKEVEFVCHESHEEFDRLRTKEIAIATRGRITLCGVVARHFLFSRFPLSKCKFYVN